MAGGQVWVVREAREAAWVETEGAPKGAPKGAPREGRDWRAEPEAPQAARVGNRWGPDRKR